MHVCVLGTYQPSVYLKLSVVRRKFTRFISLHSTSSVQFPVRNKTVKRIIDFVAIENVLLSNMIHNVPDGVNYTRMSTCIHECERTRVH